MRLAVAAAVGAALAITATACASSSSSSSPASSSAATSGSTATSGGTGAVPAADNLKAAGCPSTIVLQTDWNPEAEHGGQYELLGPNPTINAGAKSVTGELVAHGGVDTGVQLQIRAGGPAIGYQTVSSQLYKDSSITLGYVGTDEQIALSQTQPTVAVHGRPCRSARRSSSGRRRRIPPGRRSRTSARPAPRCSTSRAPRTWTT